MIDKREGIEAQDSIVHNILLNDSTESPNNEMEKLKRTGPINQLLLWSSKRRELV